LRPTPSDNLDVRALWRPGILLALALSLIASGTELRASAAAMACCKKTHFRCAGVKTADDCCRTIQKAAHHDAATSRRIIDGTAQPAALLCSAPVLHQTIRTIAHVDPFSRPHDPPHLHTFNLLI
jgi:hypothetical protein